MAPLNDPLIKHYDKDPDTGEMIPVRYMTEDEVKEREALNVANTASALRARVLKELAGRNGHGSNGTSSE